MEVRDYVNELCARSTVEALESWKIDIQKRAIENGIDVNSEIGQLFISIIDSHIDSQQMQESESTKTPEKEVV
jgi:hypothetical protein